MTPTRSREQSRAYTAEGILAGQSNHGSNHGTHGPSTHGTPPPVKGGGVTATRCTHAGSTLVRTESGFDVRVDDEVLDALDELRVILAGRRTYTLHVGSGAVFTRSAHRIRARPAGTVPRQDVHAEHRCEGS